MTTPPRHARRLTVPRQLVLLVPLVLVNAVAVWGQAGWAFNHITEAAWDTQLRWLLSVGFAAAVESIGVYLAWEAHAALMAGQSSGLLRAGSYLVGLAAGFLNYAHFAGDTYTPNPQAITFGLLSSISPWLWAIRSRGMNRDRLAELDMTDERGLKLSTSRKLWHPLRSLRVIRWAAWAGVTRPSEAVAGWEAVRKVPKAGHNGTRVDTPALARHRSDEVGKALDVPDENPGGAVSAVVFSTDERRQMARALKSFDPDMTNDMLAARLGVSRRTIERDLNGYGVST